MERKADKRPGNAVGSAPVRQDDPIPDPIPNSELAVVREHLASGRLSEARRTAEDLVARFPDSLAGLRLRGQVAEAAEDWRAALACAQRAVTLRPRNIRARLRLVQVLWRTGQVAPALESLDRVSRTAAGRPGALALVGACYASLGLYEPAYRCSLQALERRPDDPMLLASVAQSAAALGKFSVAISQADRALFLDPDHASLLERRARWIAEVSAADRGEAEVTAEAKSKIQERVNQLGFQFDSLRPDDSRRAPVGYALALELDALGHPEPAFGIWCEAARCHLLAEAHDGSEDRARFLEASEAFDAAWLQSQPASEAGAGRVFLTGLPRSGLSWVAGRLEAVAGVEVQRDTGFLARALGLAAREQGAGAMESVGRGDGPIPTGWARHAGLRPERWRDTYLASSQALSAWRHGQEAPAITVDVASSHLGALGLIRAAFPDAIIIHLRREPLDHCFDLFTTRFTTGKTWSYDLQALARHYAAYHQLMGHWRRLLPGGLVDLDIEALAREPQQIAEQVLAPLESDVRRGRGDAARGEASNGLLRLGRVAAYRPQLNALVERLQADGVPVD